MISKKLCEYKKCKEGNNGKRKRITTTARGRFCCGKCRAAVWRLNNKKDAKND